MKNLKYRTLAAAAFALSYLLASGGLRAQQAPSATSPRTLSYQGVLIASGNGIKAVGSRLLTVTLYSDANGTTKLWQSTMNTTIDSSGVFNLLLGTNNPLPEPQAMDRPIWLGVAVDNGPEMRPLSQVTASAYALNVVDNAITTAKLADSSVTTAKLANGSVTWNKMGTEYVPYIRVNGAKVTTGQNSINFTGGDGLKVDYDSNSMSVIIRPDSASTISATGKGASPMAIVANPCGTNDDGGGGRANPTSTIGGGCGNRVFDTTISGTNTHPYDYCFIGGGLNNIVSNRTQHGTNPIDEFNDYHFIGGGESNTIVTEIYAGGENGTLGYGTIAGGQGNALVGPGWGFIGGGQNNIVSCEIPTNDDDGGDLMEWDAIAGGNGNSIDSASSYSFIGGGFGNHIAGAGTSFSGIDTVHFNVTTPANRSTISGGDHNWIHSATDATISGGSSNTINTTSGDLRGNSTIGGGYSNTIGTAYGTIAGGLGNKTTNFPGSGSSDGSGAAIGGGWDNTTSFRWSNIPGGVNNVTDAEAQTVIGVQNIQAGAHHLVYTSGFNANDDRIFEIGSPYWTPNPPPNGTWNTANAFEVSYNGHSIVYETNGSSLPGAGGQPSVFQGATYVESPVYAWGEVSSAGAPVGADFGVSQITPVPGLTGVYMITLTPADPHGGPTPDITQASVTVTVTNNDTSDIPQSLPPPPAASMKGPIERSQRIPDSVILATGGSLSNTDTIPTSSTPAPLGPAAAQDSLRDGSAVTCGYATASEIGVLAPTRGPTFARTFIVRTYSTIESGACWPVQHAFFFKVCHR